MELSAANIAEVEAEKVSRTQSGGTPENWKWPTPWPMKSLGTIPNMALP